MATSCTVKQMRPVLRTVRYILKTTRDRAVQTSLAFNSSFNSSSGSSLSTQLNLLHSIQTTQPNPLYLISSSRPAQPPSYLNYSSPNVGSSLRQRNSQPYRWKALLSVVQVMTRKTARRKGVEGGKFLRRDVVVEAASRLTAVVRRLA